ncbi:shikimate kinase [Bacillus tianshenii]|uniref:Shikimate kinase n=1 Tax=Sutcliffiella tianshenii TaxID=1463404 RepID=A0ABS2NZQ2_9BACI|nr:shikimate kinase [Bacillus tianshenii]MBM7620145.1 shikimate kinase [Bacillus tianshenii]
MKSIYLTGFMGAGKTSIGHALGEKLGLSVFDTDSLIEDKAEKNISKFFEVYGEAEFRRLEKEVLQGLPVTDSIIMTGGGIIKTAENISWMKEKGLMIFLYCDMEIVLQRLAHDITRPLIQQKSKEEITALFSERLPLYQKAHITLDTSSLSVGEAALKLVDEIKSWHSGQH